MESWFDYLDLSFKGTSVNDLIVTLSTVADLVEAHKGYQGNLPEEVPGAPHFRGHAEDLKHAQADAAFKDLAKVAKLEETYKRPSSP